MKKFALLLAVAALAFNSCTKEMPTSDISNVSTERKALMIKFGSTTCGACVAQYPQMKQYLKANPYKVIGISCLQDVTNTAQGLSWQWNFSGIPAYTEGSNPQFDTTSSLSVVKEKATATIGTKADIGVGIKPVVNGSSVTINLKTILFNDLSGNYNVAVYVIENDLDVSTISNIPNDKYSHVLRGAANNKIWGDRIITGGAKKGDVIDYTMTYNLGTQGTNYDNVSKLEFVAIIYRIENNRGVEVMNCNLGKQE